MPPDARARADAFLARPAMPWIAGLVTAAMVLTFWGSLAGPPLFHDERAYIVQARLLASFSWTAPSPPMPEFWEMAHMFVVPAIFAKYPPGHAPLLVPGIWLGLPGLVPIILAGITGGFFFALSRRVIGGWSALAAWALWTSSPFVLLWQSTYFSEVTTAALWLVTLAILLEWTARERGWLLVALVAAFGWLGITRPVTGIALGIPIAIVVLRTAWKRRSLAGWKPAALVGLAIVALVPWWSWRTIGSPTEMPYAHYSTVYFPWDMPGFARDTSPPERWLPPDLVELGESTKINYVGHTPSSMLPNFFARSEATILSGVPVEARALALLVPAGLVAVGAPLALTVAASFVLVIAFYLVMPHNITWGIYYLEIFPVAPFLAMAGLAWVWTLVTRQRDPQRRTELPRWLSLAIVVFVAARVVPSMPTNRVAEDPLVARILVLEAMVDRLPEDRVVVFIRRHPAASPHFTRHDILGDPTTTPRWLVRDLGTEKNAQLIALADGRTPYLYDEETVEFFRLRPDGTRGEAINPAGR